jgi:hypothetical protein
MIGGTFEYLMSSLPNLSFQNTEETKQGVLGLLQKYAGKAVELSPVEILDSEAEKFLPTSAFYIFQKVSLKNIHEREFREHNSKVLSAFSKFTFELKKETKVWRKSQQEKEGKTVKNKLEEIIGEGTPLEKEIQIMKYQWNELEELSAGHFADVEALFTYKIKLMILLRWWSFKMEKGFEKFTQITTNN